MLLLDEPLAALDSHTKSTVRRELQDLLAGFEIPTLLVTHDFEDAAALADGVGVLVDGTIRQVGRTAELVGRPADPFVASFTGANLLRAHAEAGNGLSRVRLADGTIVSTTEPAAGDVVVAVYPWDITVATEGPHDSALNVIRAPIHTITELGNRARLRVGPVTAEITIESFRRLDLEGPGVFATFKATGTRVVAAEAAYDGVAAVDSSSPRA